MQLTKSQAIKEHRNMWNWIADQYDKDRNSRVSVLKEEYIKERLGGEQHIACNCFACDYAFNTMMTVRIGRFKYEEERCRYCPFTWVSKEEDEHSIKLRCCPCENDGSPYLRVKRAINLKQKSRSAKEIANLPERECV